MTIWIRPGAYLARRRKRWRPITEAERAEFQRWFSGLPRLREPLSALLTQVFFEVNMWFMNRIVNPIVHLILRSPLQGWLSATILLITYHGRKSGKEYTLPVQYARDGNIFYIIPARPEEKTWWRNLLGGAPVQITLQGKTLVGNGLILNWDSDQDEILKGMELYIHRFPTFTKNHNIRLDADGHANTEDLQRAAAEVKMVRLELNQ